MKPGVMFQSAPPVETRGDAKLVPPSLEDVLFQSAPPVETRGDKAKSLKEFTGQRFNPLPPSKRGETHSPYSLR